MRIIQYLDKAGQAAVGIVDGDTVAGVATDRSTYEAALAAIAKAVELSALLDADRSGATESYDEIIAAKRILLPINHPEPARCLLTGTGLTHIGSADARDRMHAAMATDEHKLSDSMKMFRWGIEGGRPPAGQRGVQAEWFYKGDSSWLVAPEADLRNPSFAQGGGEEPEMTGVYVISPDGVPYRVGFVLANEFSDHVLEQKNYLWLAHSKLRVSSFGPELVLGPVPGTINGRTRVLRGSEVVWEKDFSTGADVMSHSVENLELHHFKYEQFRRPGDIHIHFLGAPLLSFLSGFQAQPGDVFELSAEGFGRPLRNRLAVDPENSVAVRTL
jgi:hypothetical protein